MTKPTEILTDEHRYILRVINALSAECLALESGKSIDRQFFDKAIDFIRNYADKFHHAKEEDIFFEAIPAGRMQCNPISQMLHEHDVGRDYVKGLELALLDNNKISVVENARGYAALLTEHIFKEDNILYPMAEHVLDDTARAGILSLFEKAEKRRFPEGMKNRYISLAGELEKKAGGYNNEKKKNY